MRDVDPSPRGPTSLNNHAPQPRLPLARPDRFEALTSMIHTCELVTANWRGTTKLRQDKTAHERVALADAPAATGRAKEAALARVGQIMS